MERLRTVKEVAEILQTDTESVYRWLRQGKLKGVKIGGTCWRISETALAEFSAQ